MPCVCMCVRVCVCACGGVGGGGGGGARLACPLARSRCPLTWCLSLPSTHPPIYPPINTRPRMFGLTLPGGTNQLHTKIVSDDLGYVLCSNERASAALAFRRMNCRLQLALVGDGTLWPASVLSLSPTRRQVQRPWLHERQQDAHAQYRWPRPGRRVPVLVSIAILQYLRRRAAVVSVQSLILALFKSLTRLTSLTSFTQSLAHSFTH